MEMSFAERVAEAKNFVSAVSPQEAIECRELDPETVFIDPRNMDDILASTGLIPGALNIPLSKLSDTGNDTLPEVLADQSRTIITACQGGPMGALAAYALKQRGYGNVHYIEGGTQGWIDAGFDTTK